MRTLLTMLSLGMTLVSLPGGPLPLLALVSLVPIGLALHGASLPACVVYVYGCAILGWMGSTGGLISGLSSYAHVSWLEALAVVTLSCMWLALPYGVFGLLYGKFQWMKRRGGPLKTAACLTLLVSLFPSPLPIDSSHSLYRFPLLLQILDVGGQPLLLFSFYLVNWLSIDLILKLRERTSITTTVAALIGIGACVVGYGWFEVSRDTARGTQQRLRVAVIQPNIPLAGDSNPHSVDAFNPFHTLIDMSTAVLSTDPRVELVVWPETPTRIACGEESKPRPELAALATRFKVSLLINCAQPGPGGTDYNTEMLIAGNGTTSFYHKQRLFPFTEYIPGEDWIPGLRQELPGASRYAAGSQATVLPSAGMAVLIPATCYELLFRDHAWRFLSQGGNVLVSAANDAWFGASRIPEFAIAAGVFQAVANRIPVVRVSNSGNSVAVAADGSILPGSQTPVFTRTTRVLEIPLSHTRARSFAASDAFLYLLATCWLANACWRFAARRITDGRRPRVGGP